MYFKLIDKNKNDKSEQKGKIKDEFYTLQDSIFEITDNSYDDNQDYTLENLSKYVSQILQEIDYAFAYYDVYFFDKKIPIQEDRNDNRFSKTNTEMRTYFMQYYYSSNGSGLLNRLRKIGIVDHKFYNENRIHDIEKKISCSIIFDEKQNIDFLRVVYLFYIIENIAFPNIKYLEALSNPYSWNSGEFDSNIKFINTILLKILNNKEEADEIRNRFIHCQNTVKNTYNHLLSVIQEKYNTQDKETIEKHCDNVNIWYGLSIMKKNINGGKNTDILSQKAFTLESNRIDRDKVSDYMFHNFYKAPPVRIMQIDDKTTTVSSFNLLDNLYFLILKHDYVCHLMSMKLCYDYPLQYNEKCKILLNKHAGLRYPLGTNIDMYEFVDEYISSYFMEEIKNGMTKPTSSSINRKIKKYRELFYYFIKIINELYFKDERAAIKNLHSIEVVAVLQTLFDIGGKKYNNKFTCNFSNLYNVRFKNEYANPNKKSYSLKKINNITTDKDKALYYIDQCRAGILYRIFNYNRFKLLFKDFPLLAEICDKTQYINTFYALNAFIQLDFRAFEDQYAYYNNTTQIIIDKDDKNNMIDYLTIKNIPF